MRRTSALFSGQGSQYVGMLQSFVGAPEWELAKRADSLLGYALSDIYLNGPAERLKETRFTQPALFVHEALVWNVVGERLAPSAFAGHSLGEYSALYAAGVLDFDTCLRLVALRAELMFNAGTSVPGTMFAVVGLDDARVEALCEELSGPNGLIVPANYNSPGQVVISGSRDYLRQNAARFKEAGAKMVTELQVSGAFHSPLLEGARAELELHLQKAVFNQPRQPVYTNVYGVPESDPNALRTALIGQLTSPVRWTAITRQMHADGIGEYVEIGPGKVLQGLVKRTLQDVEIKGYDTATDCAAIRDIVEKTPDV